LAAIGVLLASAVKAFPKVGGTLLGLKLEATGHGVRLIRLPGEKHGYDGLSLLLSEIEPGGGPPLHAHESEELFIMYDGQATFFVGGEVFTLTAPFVQRVPAGVPHAFINSGKSLLKNTAVFSSKKYTATILAPSPLWKRV
jgi:quercetin dioxygenase-like cupin family protein